MVRKILTMVVILFFFPVWISDAHHVGNFIEPSEDYRCPVCGVFVYKYPEWVAEIVFKDGTYLLFDGPKDMFRYYFNIPQYNEGKTKEDVAEIFVTEYYTAIRMRAKYLWFIIGSGVYGPMGVEMVPVKGRANAAVFVKDHGGRIHRFSKITREDIPNVMHKYEHRYEMHENEKEFKLHIHAE